MPSPSARRTSMITTSGRCEAHRRRASASVGAIPTQVRSGSCDSARSTSWAKTTWSSTTRTVDVPPSSDSPDSVGTVDVLLPCMHGPPLRSPESAPRSHCAVSGWGVATPQFEGSGQPGQDRLVAGSVLEEAHGGRGECRVVTRYGDSGHAFEGLPEQAEEQPELLALGAVPPVVVLAQDRQIELLGRA